MRPEVVAFRELDTLVRNLSDQLAGYRRRAMAAEARTRDLESQLGSANSALAGAQSEVVNWKELTQRAELEAAAPSIAVNTTPPDPELVRENEELRALLLEARERTTQLVERVRFLRQQLGQGAEK